MWMNNAIQKFGYVQRRIKKNDTKRIPVKPGPEYLQLDDIRQSQCVFRIIILTNHLTLEFSSKSISPHLPTLLAP